MQGVCSSHRAESRNNSTATSGRIPGDSMRSNLLPNPMSSLLGTESSPDTRGDDGNNNYRWCCLFGGNGECSKDNKDVHSFA